VMETRDALDGAITPATTAADLHRVDLNLVHPLTGPVFVNGAEPGDLLEVHIVDITPQPFGFTTIIPGFGFLRDSFPTPRCRPISPAYASLPGRLWGSWAWRLPMPRGRAWRRARMNCCAVVAL
jgi:acetamidase/formamidase